MNQIIEIPKKLTVNYEDCNYVYHIKGGCFEFSLLYSTDSSTGENFLENVGGVADGTVDVHIQIPLLGCNWLSCDLVETMVMRELHKAFS